MARLSTVPRVAVTLRAVQALRCTVLESIARRSPLDGTLAAMCRQVGAMLPGVLCAATAWTDDGAAIAAAAPGLPPHLPPGPDPQAAGTVHDIAASAAWAPCRTSMLAAGLQTCWSSTVAAKDGRTAGTLALYFRTRRDPTPIERRVVEECLGLTWTAIEHADAWRLLDQANRHLDAALANLSQGVCVFDGANRLVVANRRYSELYSLPPGHVRPGMELSEIVALRVRMGTGPKMSSDAYVTWRNALHADGPAASDTLVELLNDRVIAIHHQPLVDGGWVATHDDITERRRAEAQIVHMARHDALTGLPNRLTFHDRMERALAYVTRGQGCAVLCLDLDRFKDVNDTLGHPAGDELLRATAHRLLNCVREVDTVSRQGGDEFAILLVGLTAADRAGEVAERIVRAFEPPFVLDGNSVPITTSIGIAVALDDGSTPAMLLQSADTAMYRAKLDGRGSYRFFEPEMDAKRQARVMMEHDLRQAIETEGLALAYQPLIDSESGAITGFEALLRWDHPVRGNVPPAVFVAVAEEAGLIVGLGEWVLRRACADAAGWPRPVKVSVNLAAAQFRSQALREVVRQALDTAGLAPARLELEITETLLTKGGRMVIDVLHELRATGVGVVLDNFGTESSSLSYLHGFPFDRVKIDRGFIEKLSEAATADSFVRAAAFVRAIVGLGRSLAMATTAEGVETEAQLAHLRQEGCTQMQGFLFSRAVTSEVAGQMMMSAARASWASGDDPA